MRTHRHAILCIAAVATLILVAADVAFAQRVFSRGPSSNIGAGGPSRGDGGYRGGGWGRGAAGDPANGAARRAIYRRWRRRAAGRGPAAAALDAARSKRCGGRPA